MNVLENCQFCFTETEKSRDVSFVLHAGMRGIDILNVADRVLRRSNSEALVWPQSRVLKEKGLTKAAEFDRDTLVSIRFDSQGLSPTEQETILTQAGLILAHQYLVVLAAALFRVHIGFPDRREAIGTADDEGDLFKGFWVRTYYKATLFSSPAGIQLRGGWSQAYYKKIWPRIVVAGMPKNCGSIPGSKKEHK